MIRVFGLSITPFCLENDWDVWQGSRGGRGVVVSWGGGVIVQGTGSGLQGQGSKVQGPGGAVRRLAARTDRRTNGLVYLIICLVIEVVV